MKVQNANTLKMNKYEHYVTDITARDVPVHSFEIGSRGDISLLNRANLMKLYKFYKPNVSFKTLHVRKSINPCTFLEANLRGKNDTKEKNWA